ncbi:MAG: PVC-type heme-binding CxxCH protein [Chthoniobacteraceae bacterium]
MRPLLLLLLSSVAFAQDGLKSKTTYAKAYGETKNPVAVDPAKDLPRYPAVAPKDAIATWKVKPGYKLQLAAHEPQVRDPIAVSFDENGRMFVCEMIDYSEMRDETPHLGRISLLEDKDGDGFYETSRVFADNLPWPTGLIWANGGLYVGATPDIWRFEDRDGDGRAEVREKVFTGFGTGLKLLNVQGLMNSFQWGPDNRVHILSGSGNRGLIACPKRPDLPAQEIGGRNFWFDPRTHDFGFEASGAQYGMSFDNYGRKFGCSNSDHLQTWVYDDRGTARNPFFTMPPSRQSIAADGGAAEVFRLSPDEPWRIIRTRWRIAGVVKGVVEGGGRVSGYFTGATGTTVFRGDAYGDDIVNNTFSGDAGGQLVHRKKIHPDGASLIGRRPDDEQGFEFAASTDTWVRVVNFANAPDGCLHICDMYREVIEHPHSIPDEIKKFIDLNSGNDRGRIYRIVPDNKTWQRRGTVALGKADTAELVKTLAHPNGWHRDTASRLIYERHDKTAVPPLDQLFREPSAPLARLHALGVLSTLGALSDDTIALALRDPEWFVRERAIVLCRASASLAAAGGAPALQALVDDPNPRVRFQLALALGDSAALARLAAKDHADKWISAAILSHPPQTVAALFAPMTSDAALAKQAAPFVAKLIESRAATKDGVPALIDFIAARGANPLWLRALGDGLRRAGTTIAKADTQGKLGAVFTNAATTAADPKAATAARLQAIELLAFTPGDALQACLGKGQPDPIQAAAIETLAQQTSTNVTKTLLEQWPHYGTTAKDAALAALIARDDRATALLAAVQAGSIKASDLSASHVQSLVRHKDTKIAALANNALASVLPPSRAEMIAKFQPALTMKGDAARGQTQFIARCFTCHRAAGQGFEVGPDLITVKTKGRDALLTAILDPHKEVASQYIGYLVNTKDGQTVTGIISKDDANSLTVRSLGGIEQTIPRSNIKGSTSDGRSLMPEGLETGLDVQGMADLLAFIEELK